MSSSARTLLAAVVVAVGAVMGAAPAVASSHPAKVGHYNHVFVIIEENHSFTDVIGNPAAPNLNALASTYGVATKHFGARFPRSTGSSPTSAVTSTAIRRTASTGATPVTRRTSA
jgi:acid phosphatase